MSAPEITTAPPAAKQNNGVGLSALIVSLVALLFAVIPVLSFIAWLPAVAAIVLGIIGLVLKNRKRLFAGLGLGIGILAWIIAIIVSIAGAASLISEVNDTIATSTSTSTSTSTPTPTATAEPSPTAEEPPAAEPVEEEPVAEEPEFTLGQQNAIQSATQYLDFSAFSRFGLIQQLTSEYGSGFDPADAEFAVTYLEQEGLVDWNEQAALSAQNYLDFSSFSRDGLYDQLTSEYGSGFTHEQAEHGLRAVGY